MTILYNDQPIQLPEDNMTIADLAKWKHLPEQGTAIALNDKLVTKAKWSVTQLNELDRITVITAAFGG